jgi:hypothetical protein
MEARQLAPFYHYGVVGSLEEASSVATAVARFELVVVQPRLEPAWGIRPDSQWQSNPGQRCCHGIALA